jgi:hypothetical protein
MTKRTYVEADGDARTVVDNIGRFYVPTASGGRVPLSAITSVERISGPEYIMRFNEYKAVQMTVSGKPGYSSGQVMAALEDVFKETMPTGMGYDYKDMSYEEKQASQGTSEFGNKVSVAVSSRGGWFVGAKSFVGNPYDGHTLAEQMKQVKNLVGDKVREMHVDMGYRGHDYDGAVTVHVDKRRRARTPLALWRWMKRRAAVEPSIGHLKSEHRLDRNRLKGIEGNAINAILSAAAMNFHKLLGAFLRIFPPGPIDAWNRLSKLQRQQVRNAQLQYA